MLSDIMLKVIKVIVIMLKLIMVILIILNVSILSVIMLNVIIMSVIILSVWAPFSKASKGYLVNPKTDWYFRLQCLAMAKRVSATVFKMGWRKIKEVKQDLAGLGNMPKIRLSHQTITKINATKPWTWLPFQLKDLCMLPGINNLRGWISTLDLLLRGSFFCKK